MDQDGFIERLKAFRGSLRISQKDLAGRLGISPTTYNAWETGRSYPGAPAIHGLTELGLNAHWLLTGEGRMSADGQAATGAPSLTSGRGDDGPSGARHLSMDHGLREAAEQLQRFGLTQPLLMGSRGRMTLRWQILKTLKNMKDPLPPQELLAALAEAGQGQLKEGDVIAEVEICKELGMIEATPSGLSVVTGARIPTRDPGDNYALIQLMMEGLGREVVPAIVRADGSGGIGIWEAVVRDGRAFLVELRTEIRSIVERHSAEEGDGVSVYLGAAETDVKCRRPRSP